MCASPYYVICTFLVTEVSINVSQSTEGLIIGLAHKLICTFLVTDGVLPLHVDISWSGSALLSESPQIIISNLTNNGSLYTKTITFLPLLSHDEGEYTCYAEIIGFNETKSSENLTVIAKGMYIQ